MLQLRATSGFTLVEIIIVVTVCGILTGLLFGPLSDLYSANTQGLTSIIQTTDVKSTLRQMEKTLALGNSFAAQSFPDSNGKSWNWNDTTYSAGNPLIGNPLIINSYATEVNASGNRVIAMVYYANCSNFPQRMSYNTVFFVKKDAGQNTGTLYRRTITPTPSTACDDPIKIEQKTSCDSPPAGCTIRDAVIATNVTDFTVKYFAASDGATPDTSPSAASFPTYKTVTVSLTTTVGVGTTQTSVTNSLRMSLVNV